MEYDFFLIVAFVAFLDVLIQKEILNSMRKSFNIKGSILKKYLNRIFPFAIVFLSKEEDGIKKFIEKGRRINYGLLSFVICFTLWIIT